MAVVWSISALLITVLISTLLNSKKDHNIQIFKVGFIIKFLVLSHWVLDFIGWPMTVINPILTGVPIFFSDSVSIGLGVYSTWFGALTMDIGVFLVGFVIYLHYIKKIKK